MKKCAMNTIYINDYFQTFQARTLYVKSLCIKLQNYKVFGFENMSYPGPCTQAQNTSACSITIVFPEVTQ